MSTDEAYQGAFLRSDGVKIVVHEGEDFAGKPWFYWCEAVNSQWADGNLVYTSGKSGQGPYSTAKEACKAGLNP